MGRFIDLTGMVFGRLTVVCRGPRQGAKITWACRCECGRLSMAHGQDLRSGKHRSCGCLHLERVTKHGVSAPGRRTPTYHSWTAMKMRCLQPNHRKYAYYGGRGITICERWRNSFSAFVEDMGERPAGHSLDRIDTNGNYEPGNCRWATRDEQRANQRPRGTC